MDSLQMPLPLVWIIDRAVVIAKTQPFFTTASLPQISLNYISVIKL